MQQFLGAPRAIVADLLNATAHRRLLFIQWIAAYAPGEFRSSGGSNGVSA